MVIIKKLLTGAVLAAVLAAALTACAGAKPAASSAPETKAQTSAVTEASAEASSEDNSGKSSSAPETERVKEEAAPVRVGSLSGPTTMGLVRLMEASEKEDAALASQTYEFTMTTQPDEIAGLLTLGKLDIALIPANLASVLYHKSNADIRVIDINTLGVLYCVTADESIKSAADLAGRTVVLTGQGNTPEYALRFLLKESGAEGTELQFKSEAKEVLAALTNDPSLIGVLPQPFVTSALMQNQALKTAFSLTEEWDKVSPDSRMLTGVTVVRADFLKNNEDAVKAFLSDHKKSVDAVNADPASAGVLVEQYGIVAKAAIAQKAVPACNLVCITGEEMHKALSGYLGVLFSADPKSVGGSLPDDGFYYTGE